MALNQATGGNLPFNHPVRLLVLTIVITISATTILCVAVFADEWEVMHWDMQKLTTMTETTFYTTSFNGDIYESSPLPMAKQPSTIYLVPMVGGIWSRCLDVTHSDIQQLSSRFRRSKVVPCTYYLSSKDRSVEPRTKSVQNLAISCSMVCLINLATAWTLGTFGIFGKQNSAILVTGIMYFLTGLFAMFTSAIMVFKRQYVGVNSYYDGILAENMFMINPSVYEAARLQDGSWSLGLGLFGAIMCALASLCWLFLAKVLRSANSQFAI